MTPLLRQVKAFARRQMLSPCRVRHVRMRDDVWWQFVGELVQWQCDNHVPINLVRDGCVQIYHTRFSQRGLA